jgi:hypothetical protein
MPETVTGTLLRKILLLSAFAVVWDSCLIFSGASPASAVDMSPSGPAVPFCCKLFDDNELTTHLAIGFRAQRVAVQLKDTGDALTVIEQRSWASELIGQSHVR